MNENAELAEEYRQQLISVKALRVTGAQSFESCPHKWHVEQFGAGKRRESKYARIGTAVHKVAEMFVTGQINVPWSEVADWLRGEGVNAEETDNCFEYLHSLAVLGLRVIAVEQAFELEVAPGLIPLLGHMDLVAVSSREALVVLDHKTNRQSEPAATWARRLQPVLYSMAARRLYPGFAAQKFIIGYPNLGTFVEWDVDPAQNEAEAIERYAAIYRDMQLHSAKGFYEQRVHDGCRYCPVKSRCGALADLGASVLIRSLGGLK